VGNPLDTSPEGASETSPALQRWVTPNPRLSPVGTAEITMNSSALHLGGAAVYRCDLADKFGHLEPLRSDCGAGYSLAAFLRSLSSRTK